MGLGGWVWNRIQRAASNQAAIELTEFTSVIRGFDVREVALVAAQAAHVAHLVRQSGLNLLRPQLAHTTNPRLMQGLTTMAIRLRKRGQPEQVPGFMVWVHTLRAEERPELRYLAKEMWGYLEPGFDEAELAAFEFETATGYRLVVDPDLLMVPEGYGVQRAAGARSGT